MIKLALIGKNIQHSKSPEIYRRLLNCDIQYDLLDFENASQIPKAQNLLDNYQGISITSPYKKHFLTELELSPNAKVLNAINCFGKKDKKIIGENTDYLAILDILNSFISTHGSLNVVILGDGVMAKVTEVALSSLAIEYKIFSRKLTLDFNQLRTSEIFKNSFKSQGQKLIINTCAREFIFSLPIERDAIFWDYNYNFLPHLNSLPAKVSKYIDGLEMLELQARHALAFWSIKPL